MRPRPSIGLSAIDTQILIMLQYFFCGKFSKHRLLGEICIFHKVNLRTLISPFGENIANARHFPGHNQKLPLLIYHLFIDFASGETFLPWKTLKKSDYWPKFSASEYIYAHLQNTLQGVDVYRDRLPGHYWDLLLVYRLYLDFASGETFLQWKIFKIELYRVFAYMTKFRN